MKIYIASKFASRHRLQPIKWKLQQMGFEVLSDWITPNPLDDALDGDYDSIANNLEVSTTIAERDIVQVKECDVYIIDTQDQSSTGGREVELGIALLSNCFKFRVGPIRNVFHALLPGFKSWDELIPLLEEIGK